VKIAFLMYDNRSGSTLLAAKLNRFESICVTRETRFVRRLIDRRNIPFNAQEELINFLFKEEQFEELKISRERLRNETTWPIISLSSLIKEVASLLTIGDPEVLILKDPVYRYINPIKAIWPDAQFIHIVRDGRAVYCSKRNSTNISDGRAMTDSALHAAIKWQQKLMLAKRNSSDIIEIKYEQFILDEEKVIKRLLTSMGIENFIMSKTVDNYSSLIGDKQKKLHSNISKASDVEKINAWKNKILESDLLVYQLVAKQALQSNSYDILPVSKKIKIFMPAFILRDAWSIIVFAIKRILSVKSPIELRNRFLTFFMINSKND
jgi:hypothetical protein